QPVSRRTVATTSAPPSIGESLVQVAARIVWPVLIALAIFGVGSWISNIVIAIIASAILRQLALGLRRRRHASPQLPPTTPTEDLR
ncbi:MAG: hypothetical protein WAL91_07940, partial [Propionicimonas sp.]